MIYGERLATEGNGCIFGNEAVRYEESVYYTRISDYERGKRVPPLALVLEYARIAGIHVEDLIDDELDLPPKLPGKVRYRGPKRSSKPRRTR